MVKDVLSLSLAFIALKFFLLCCLDVFVFFIIITTGEYV